MTPPEGATFATQFTAQIGVQVDALSTSFAAAIAFATLIIQAYALTAMRGEAGFRRFFWASSVLGFSTTAFVLSPNLFNSLIMWVVRNREPRRARVTGMAASRHRRARAAHRRDPHGR